MVQAPTQQLLLQLPSEIMLTVTPEQFAALAAVNRELKLKRTMTGELIVSPPIGSESGRRNAKIIHQLSVWGEANQHLGEYFDSSTRFELPNGAVRSPDASWVQKERWQALTIEQRKRFAPLCPDFVVELRSETNNIKDLRAKMQEYMDNRSQLGWLIDPHNKCVEIYHSGQAIEVLENPSQLSGEGILPGFTLSLEKFWE